jgi:serine/threonine-protein kinase
VAGGLGGWKLADFGIAKWVSTRVETKAGLVLGTPTCLSPERLRGEASGPAADLYTLGILMYELLAGNPPLRG